MGGVGNIITKVRMETFGGDEYVHLLECGGSFPGACIFQNLTNYTL